MHKGFLFCFALFCFVLFLWGVAERTGIVQSGEEEAQGDLIILYDPLKGGCGEVDVGLFSQVTAIGREVMFLGCTSGSSGWVLGRISSQK